jgi:hypothetical protein
MSKRFRHEDREAVPKGWKVRTVKAGAHRVRVAFPPGRKVTGSGRLVSILHPVGENASCGLRSSNPAELMVMGANPPRTRRNNAYRVVAVPRWGGAPVTQDFETKEAAKQHAHGLDKSTYFKPHIQKVRKNPAELMVMGANPRVELYRSENPSAETIAEQFSGRPVADWVEVDHEPHMPKGRYAHLGDLVGLTVKPMHGGQVQGIVWWDGPANAAEIENYNGPLKPLSGAPELFSDESARQIYLYKGGQDLGGSLDAFGAHDRGNGLFDLGHGRVIRYRAKKSVEDSGLIDWVHRLGEENGVHPKVVYDATHKRILYEGGDYRIEGFWIMN